MKKLLLILAIIATGKASYSQESYLDTKKYAQCELFAEKSDYDWKLRLLQIDSLVNQEVTVFEIKSKDNRIKKSYTGKVGLLSKKVALMQPEGMLLL